MDIRNDCVWEGVQEKRKMNYCHIAKDKLTGEKFLIPMCYSVANNWHLDYPDRQIIKDFCVCDRPKRKGNERYVELEKDEVIERINKLENRISKVETILQKFKDELDICKEEVLLLRLEEDVDFSPRLLRADV